MLKTIIGLEIHAQLKTQTKAFCNCANDSQSQPNTNICPICTGQPGTLPRVNRMMIEQAIKAAVAFNGKISHRIVFDRKNYFSADMPKGYQITQHQQPLAQNGWVEILNPTRKKKITINEIHLEEDSARTIKKKDPLSGKEKYYLDFNRSGIPLIEIVTAPEISSPKEAAELFEAIHMILVYLDICDGHLELGTIRTDANISLLNSQTGKRTGRVEIKNINSFKNLEKALTYEEEFLIDQFHNFPSEKALTKDWDEKTRATIPSRDKETSCDYRYFEEPDLPEIRLEHETISQFAQQISENPFERLERLIHDYHLRFDIAKSLIIDRPLADFFEQTMKILSTDEMKHLILRDVKAYLNHSGKDIVQTHLTPEKLYQLLKYIKSGQIAPTLKTKLLKTLCETPKETETIIEEENFIKIDDQDSLLKILETVIKENEEQYEAYICGKNELLKWFIGQMIKRTKGRTDPKLIIRIIKKRMGGIE